MPTWLCILILIVALIFYWLLLQWKKFADEYDAWVQRNCPGPSPGDEPPKRPGFP